MGNDKVYHKGAKINARGDVSALCFETPRAINLKRASWTYRESAVTCPKCQTILRAQRSPSDVSEGVKP